MAHTLDLTKALTVEYADAEGGGCMWHEDPDCLCDVDPSRFVVGDGGYVIPPDMDRRFREGMAADADCDGWFFDSWDQSVKDTAIRELGNPIEVSEVLGIITNHPDVVRRLFDDRATSVEDIAIEAGVSPPSLRALAKFLVLRPRGKTLVAHRNVALRAECVRLYEEGTSAEEINEWAYSLRPDLTQGQVATWLRRYSPRYQAERYRPRGQYKQAVA
jgi:hypothetical protein